MTSKLNIFNALPQHASDSEDETTAKNAKNKLRRENQEQRKNDTDKGQAKGHTAPRDPNQKEDVTRQKTSQRTKGVTADPHPQDRQSGTGTQAYGNKPKKAGTGKGNWGNFKEDKKGGEEVVEGEESPVAQEEEKPEGITLSEYLANKKSVSNQPQVNEAKSKITSDQLMKELGKATALKTRLQQDIDDKRVGKKKDRLDVDHKATINSEHADLLNFRTGFVEKEYREKTRGGEEQPRKFGGERKRREEEPAQPQAEGAQTEGAATEGQQAGETAATEGQAQAKTEGQGEKRRHEGNRGGYKPKGGDRPQGGRSYGGKQGQTTKVNVEDESAFPKLG